MKQEAGLESVINITSIGLFIRAFCFILISISLLLMKFVKITGYEISIYKSLSFPIFLLLIPITFSMVDIFIIKPKKLYLIIDIILFLIVGLIILLLPIIKGYTFYPMGDPPTHVGTIRDIIINGKFEETIYPVTHILISYLYLISNIDFVRIAMFSAPLYSFIAIAYLYVLAYNIFEDVYKAVLGVLIGFFELSTVIPNPHIFAVLSIPLILIVFLRIVEFNSTGYKSIIIIFAILLPFFHPMVDIIFIMSILFMGIIYMFILSISRWKMLFYYISAISTITFLLWLWNNFWFWNYHIGRVFRWFIFGINETGRFGDVTSIIKENGINMTDLIVKVYGQNILYVILSFLSIF